MKLPRTKSVRGNFMLLGELKRRRLVRVAFNMICVPLLVFSCFGCCVFSKKLGLNIARNRLVVSELLLEGC